MTTGINSTDYSELGLNTHQAATREVKKELGQADFLALLTTQLAYQDPTAPVDNKEFISQMSQFASVDSLQTLVNQFGELSNSLTSNQALQASSLVGRSVLIPGSDAYLMEGAAIGGQLNLEASTTNIRVEVKDEAGQVVFSSDFGSHEAGDVDFVWDGLDSNGERLPPGLYSIAAYGQVGGSTEQLATSVVARVESVNLGGSEGGVLLNLTGLGQIEFSDVKEIG
ncbi:flagellar hook assembly protein FlgD [Aliikangiella coralliicola]|uniref:Basal-body rod modification protein FlgD n=1 Tax=Aliikangiella coralliicola TaxID=2592383 RepID=A0A545U5Y1_9GAMM|nr:flagellar hook assembly protein FlgD [Aliikangiella coralliicola]TQV84871.1 flagellar hook assembly protein FlgD [Aliikangiella coralliicola]